jgi:hypothetical protein
VYEDVIHGCAWINVTLRVLMVTKITGTTHSPIESEKYIFIHANITLATWGGVSTDRGVAKFQTESMLPLLFKDCANGGFVSNIEAEFGYGVLRKFI